MHAQSHSHRTSRGRLRRVSAGVFAAVCVTTALGAVSSAQAASPTLRPNDPSPITEWNAIAISTLAAATATVPPTKSPVEMGLYMSFVHAAMYDAVVGIHPKYEPYTYNAPPERPASAQAAAVAAAHRILTTYLPSATASLDAAMAASLAKIGSGKATDNGVAYGHAVADNLIAERADDGRNDPSVTFNLPPAPGIWRPTPLTNAPMAIPWMAYVTPMLVESGAQFDPGPPMAMDSPQYTREFNEVKEFGAKVNSARSEEQTATALFFSGNSFVQYNAALRAQVSDRGMKLVDAARLFAAVDMSIADAVISIWYAKLTYGQWRPITAIQEAGTDPNPNTSPDPSWEPFIASGTPPYPDWVSGYSGITGAFTTALATTLGTSDLDLTLISTAVPGATRSYDSPDALNQDVVDARIWLGIHFRSSDTAGISMGQQVANAGLPGFLN